MFLVSIYTILASVLPLNARGFRSGIQMIGRNATRIWFPQPFIKNQAKNPIHSTKIYWWIRCTCWIRWTCCNNLNHCRKYIFLVSIDIYLVSQHINVVSGTCETNNVRTEKYSVPIHTFCEQIHCISEHSNIFSEPKHSIFLLGLATNSVNSKQILL